MFKFIAKKIKTTSFLISHIHQNLYKRAILKPRLKKLIKKTESSYTNREIIDAINFADQAYDIAIIVYDEDHPEIVEALSNKALFLFKKKDFIPSRMYFEKAININWNSSIPNKHRLCEAYDGLGNVHRITGDYEKSLSYRKYVAFLAQSCNDSNLGPYFFELARTFKIINKYDEAINTYFKSISASEEMISSVKLSNTKFFKQIIYNCNNDLAEIHLSVGNVEEAKNYHAKALRILNNQSNFFEGYRRFEIPAKIYIDEGKYKQAIEQLQKAEKAIIKEYQGIEVGKDLANIIHQIGECYIQLKQYSKALITYQKALIAVCNTFKNEAVEQLPAIEDIYNKRSAIASLSYKASTFLTIFEEEEEALEQAYHTYQLIVALIPITRRDYVEENSKFQLADETKGIYEKAIATCLKLHQLRGNEKYTRDAFHFAESSKAIVLQENLQVNYALEGMGGNIQQQDIEYRSKIAFYQNSINTNKATAGNEAQVKTWESDLFKLKEAYQSFQKQIEANFPNYYALKYANTIANIKSIQKTLPSETAVIEYFTGSENTSIFVITANQFFVYEVEISIDLLQQDIKQFNQLIQQPDRTGSVETFQLFKNLSNKLYQYLLANALSQLNASIKRLIIIPDDLLYNISFDALLFSEKEHNPPAFYSYKNLDYLHKIFTISYNYSATILLSTLNIKGKNHKNTFCGFAPDFDNLENNITEVETINSFMVGANKLHNAANFENFKSSAKESKILHLSTHAKQNESNHKLSEIQLADEVITNFHIENMQITADLTVLSACETAAGLLQSGEGAMSLSRSFFLAGCPSMVSSLWRADDESTADVMLYFYQHLKAGGSKDVALQQAKLQFCEEAGIRESHPFYWAGFVQSGNRKALF